MQGSTYNPLHVVDLEKNKLIFNGLGVSGLATAGTTTNLDLTLSDDHLLSGAWFHTSGGVDGDSAVFQVIDPTGFTGYPAGTVLSQFITWKLPSAADMQFNIPYPAKILSGLLLRLAYTSTAASGGTAPFALVNYFLHKVLL